MSADIERPVIVKDYNDYGNIINIDSVASSQWYR